MKESSTKRVKRSKQDKTYYMDSYYLRYFLAMNKDSYREIDNTHRSLLEIRGERGEYPILEREQLAKCCEERTYEEEREQFEKTKKELIGPLPDMTENFVKAFCRFFQVEQEDICFSVEKKTGETESKWEKKRRMLRQRRDEMILESARLEELLIIVLKVCDIGYLSKIYEYLADFLRTQTRRFWMDMEEQLESMKFYPYLGYQNAIDVVREETSPGWDYPVKEESVFQVNGKLSREIVSSLMKRQGMKNHEELANALSSREKKVDRAHISDLISGKRNGTPLKKEIANRMREILHAGWQDMKEDNSRFWTERTEKNKVAVWETAEVRMKQAVRKIGPAEWEKILHGNDENGRSGEAELVLAIENIIRFSLCGYETERSKKLLEILEKKAAENEAERNEPKTVTDDLFRRCIQKLKKELKEEDPQLTKLTYIRLLNEMRAELCLQEAFERELEKWIRQKTEEMPENEVISKSVQKKLREQKEQKEVASQRIREGWLQGIKTSIIGNPWFLPDRRLTITWVNDVKSEEAAVLENAIEVRIQLPRELDEMLDPGEIIARLPYEGGVKLDKLISDNWDIICERMDESFGLELEGWDAEIYEEWKEDVAFKSEKVFYEDYEPYNVNNKMLDQMTPDETYGNRYERFAARGRESFEKNGNSVAAANKEVCYEEGVHLLRSEEKLKKE